MHERGMLTTLCNARILWPLWVMKPPIAAGVPESQRDSGWSEAEEWYSRGNVDDDLLRNRPAVTE
jgi:hypothetical protein